MQLVDLRLYFYHFRKLSEKTCSTSTAVAKFYAGNSKKKAPGEIQRFQYSQFHLSFEYMAQLPVSRDSSSKAELKQAEAYDKNSTRINQQTASVLPNDPAISFEGEKKMAAKTAYQI